MREGFQITARGDKIAGEFVNQAGWRHIGDKMPCKLESKVPGRGWMECKIMQGGLALGLASSGIGFSEKLESTWFVGIGIEGESARSDFRAFIPPKPQ